MFGYARVESVELLKKVDGVQLSRRKAYRHFALQLDVTPRRTTAEQHQWHFHHQSVV